MRRAKIAIGAMLLALAGMSAVARADDTPSAPAGAGDLDAALRAYDRGDDIDCMANRADVGCGIERGAHLVVDDRRVERGEEVKNRRQMAIHPLGSLRSRDPRNPYDAAVWKAF